jgi:hypothetical protein
MKPERATAVTFEQGRNKEKGYWSKKGSFLRIKRDHRGTRSSHSLSFERTVDSVVTHTSFFRISSHSQIYISSVFSGGLMAIE